MVKKLISPILILFILSSCSSIKPLAFSGNQQVVSAAQPQAAQPVKFLDNIDASPATRVTTVENNTPSTNKTNFSLSNDKPASDDIFSYRSGNVEKASALQLKYAILLNTEVEQLENTELLQSIDQWYGTRYRMGGTTKTGIDCSAFVRAVYLSTYNVPLPRTAREQYRVSRIISRTELKEGDLLFFNTRGGVSHVGIYLQNNKFAHASSSLGVTISDIFDPYYLSRFIGAGRIEKPDIVAKD